MPRPYDRLFKLASEADPRGLLHVAGIVGIDDDAKVMPIERELVQKTLVVDQAFRIESAAGVRIALTEAQTYWKWEVPQRLLDYAMALVFRYGFPVDVVLIMLAERHAPQTLPEEIVKSLGGLEVTLRYRIVRMWEIDGRSVLKMNRPEILPLVSMMAGDESMVVDAGVALQASGGMVGDLLTLAGLRYDIDALERIRGSIRMIIREEILRESVYLDIVRDEAEAKGIEKGKAEGIEKGKAEGAAEMLRQFIEMRFPSLSTMPELQLLANPQSMKRLMAELMKSADEQAARDLIRSAYRQL
jgi:predicted transposase YdaD